LTLAGIDVVESFEWWAEAALTHERNFRTPVKQIDIRSLDVDSLPPNLDFVVGSPPCTQFSFANRGGNGDIADGLRDITKFMEVVEYVRPRYWVMENVPRVAKILERELKPQGRLRRFRELISEVLVVDMAEYGLPQARKRMLAGHFPAGLLASYRSTAKSRTLGDVVRALEGDPVVDPVYGYELPRDEVRGLAHEVPLDFEEVRMNREAKEYHPVYNVMQFPDALDRPSRTVTALCTRVSRESIVIEGDKGFRRLSLRERASLQGFPIAFEFYGKTHSSNLKMIGNAFPPLMTYYVAQALQGRSDVRQPGRTVVRNALQRGPAQVEVRPDIPRRRYPSARKFRAAITGLRFGSGTRVELNNSASDGPTRWGTTFFFGTSKDFRRVELDDDLLQQVMAVLKTAQVGGRPISEAKRSLFKWLKDIDWQSLQAVWCHRLDGVHPFEVADRLGEAAFEVDGALAEAPRQVLEDAVVGLLLPQRDVKSTRARKLRFHSSRILAGLLVGCWFNEYAKAQQLQLL